MDDITSNVTNETKIKDGYTQLAEKMDQVKNQVARMERKYDELYQAVKEKDMSKTGNVSHEPSSDQQQSPDVKTHRESMFVQSPTKPVIKSDDSPRLTESREETSNSQQQHHHQQQQQQQQQPQQQQQQTSPTADMDIEKMEDNPFV